MEQAGGKTADLLRRGVDAAKAKRKAEAYQLLSEAVLADPGSEQGWLWLAAVAPTPEESRAAFERVLMINPANEQALVGRRWAQSKIKSAEPQQPSPLSAVASSAAAPAETAPPIAPPTVAPEPAKPIAAVPPVEAPMQPEPSVATFTAPEPEPEPVAPVAAPPVMDNPPRRSRGTNVLNPDVVGDFDEPATSEPALPTWLTNLAATQPETPATPPPAAPATPRRVPGTTPLRPPAGDPWEDVPAATTERSRAVTPGSDLTSENYPAVLAPTPRVPVRPGGTKPLEIPDNMPYEEAQPGTPLSSPLTVAPTSAASASVATPDAEPEASGLDAILPRRGAPGWVESDEDSADVVPLPRVKPPVAIPAAPVLAPIAAATPAQTTSAAAAEPAPEQAPAAEPTAARPSIAPVPVTSRGSIWPLVALIVLVVVAIIIALLVFTRGSAGATPQAAAQSFFDNHFAGSDAAHQAALALTSGQLKIEYSNGPVLELSAYPTTQKWQALVQPLAIASNSKSADVYVYIAPQGQAQSTTPAYDAHMVEDGGWKIDSVKSP